MATELDQVSVSASESGRRGELKDPEGTGTGKTRILEGVRSEILVSLAGIHPFVLYRGPRDIP